MSQRNAEAAILDAARYCAISRGISRSTLSDVARRAGTSRMTLYRSFPEASQLWTRVLTEELGVVVAQAERGAAHEPTARDSLVHATVYALQALCDNPLVRKVLELEPDLLLPYLVERLGSSQQAVIELLRRYIAVGNNDGSIRSGDVEAMAYILALVCRDVVLSINITESNDLRERMFSELGVLLDAFLRPHA